MVEYSIRLDSKDLATIAAGLGELQLKISKPTFDKINAQVAAIAAASAAAPKAEESVRGTD